MTASAKQPTPQPTQASESPLAIVSLVLGAISLTGPGLLLGIPAIVTASIALKKDLPGRGLSIAGLVTGIVSTVISLLFIAFMIMLIIIGINEADNMPPQYHQQQMEQNRLFDGAST